jgi:hypothetical protein
MPRSRRTTPVPPEPSNTADDRAFRRERLLDALTDTLYRLRLKQHGIDPATGGV